MQFCRTTGFWQLLPCPGGLKFVYEKQRCLPLTTIYSIPDARPANGGGFVPLNPFGGSPARNSELFF